VCQRRAACAVVRHQCAYGRIDKSLWRGQVRLCVAAEGGHKGGEFIDQANRIAGDRIASHQRAQQRHALV
jgi:hypothetical protein